MKGNLAATFGFIDAGDILLAQRDQGLFQLMDLCSCECANFSAPSRIHRLGSEGEDCRERCWRKLLGRISGRDDGFVGEELRDNFLLDGLRVGVGDGVSARDCEATQTLWC